MPVLYKSKRTKKNQQRYSSYDLETLGIITALDHCRPYVYGQPIQVLTDHDALKYLMNQTKLSHRQARHLHHLLEYSPLIEYIPGKTNALADGLSRLKRIVLLKEISKFSTEDEFFEQIKIDYQSFPRTKELLRALTDPNYETDVNTTPFEIIDDLLYYHDYDGKEKLVIPPGPSLTKILQINHDVPTSGHHAAKKMISRISKKNFVFHLRKHVNSFVLSCPLCQSCKRKVNTNYPTQHMNPNGTRWEHLSMDFMLELPEIDGFDQLLVVVDRVTKRVHFVPCSQHLTAQQCADLFIQHIFRLHGLPKTILSDRDHLFTSAFWKHIWGRLGAKIKMSTKSRPQTDGSTKVVNRSINIMMQIFTNYHMDNWVDLLPLCEFAYNSAVHTTTGLSPFECDLGYNPRGINDMILDNSDQDYNNHEEFLEQVRDTLDLANQAIYKSNIILSHRDKIAPPSTYNVGDKVLVVTEILNDPLHAKRPKKKWRPTYSGPYEILEKKSDYVYTIKFPKHIPAHLNVNITFLRPFVETNTEEFPLRDTLPEPVIGQDGLPEFHINEISAFKLHRGKPYFLTKYEGYPDYTMEWCHYTCFFDEDGTINEQLLEYVKKNPAAITDEIKNLWPSDVTMPRVPARTRASRYNRQHQSLRRR